MPDPRDDPTTLVRTELAIQKDRADRKHEQLERALERLANRDREIASLRTRVSFLEDRLREVSDIARSSVTRSLSLSADLSLPAKPGPLPEREA